MFGLHERTHYLVRVKCVEGERVFATGSQRKVGLGDDEMMVLFDDADAAIALPNH